MAMMKDEMMIIDAWKGRKTNRIPLWLMRQAGRYLPEYRDVRAKAGGFLKMVYDPALAAAVTLQPLRRFDLDAAILFSDILVVPHALGLGLDFLEGEGPRLETVCDADGVARLRRDGLMRRLSPVIEAALRVRGDLSGDKALIGFAGSPWTVASYMVHGGGGHDFAAIKDWAARDPQGFGGLIDVLVDCTVEYLDAQIRAGADAVQLFESWAGVLTGADFQRWVIAPNARIATGVKALHPGVPVIGFPRSGVAADVAAFAAGAGIDAVGLSQDVDLIWVAQVLQPSVCVQGNLAPEILLEGGNRMVESVLAICETLGRGPFVFNLGHGVIKETPPEHVAALVEAVHGWTCKERAA